MIQVESVCSNFEIKTNVEKGKAWLQGNLLSEFGQLIYQPYPGKKKKWKCKVRCFTWNMFDQSIKAFYSENYVICVQGLS